MIPDINESFEDLSSPSKRSILILNANKALTFQVDYPIVWEGNLNGKPIKLNQPEKYIGKNSIIFEKFPEEYDKHKDVVINFINACLKKKGA